MLADARSLDALDFARVRERVAGQTHARAGASAARSRSSRRPTPHSCAGSCRRRPRCATLVREQHFSRVAQIADVERGARDRAAAVRRSVPRELRAIADALAAAGALVRAIREAERELPALRERASAFRALPAARRAAFTRRSTSAERVLDRASPALGADPPVARASARRRARPHDRADALGRVRARDPGRDRHRPRRPLRHPGQGRVRRRVSRDRPRHERQRPDARSSSRSKRSRPTTACARCARRKSTRSRGSWPS